MDAVTSARHGIHHAAVSLHFIAKRQIHFISKVSRSAAAERQDSQESEGYMAGERGQNHYSGRPTAGGDMTLQVGA